MTLNSFFSAIAAAALLTACNQGGPPANYKHNKTGTGAPLATWKGDSITDEELKTRFQEMSPFARARYQTVEQRRDYVDGLARFELLASEALARGLQNDPEVVETAKKVMVQKLMQKELDEKPNPVSDEEVAAYYQKHVADYVKPEMVRLTHIFLAADTRSPNRAAKKKQAEDLQKAAAALQPMDLAAFSRLVRENSEEPRTKPLDGDMRYLTMEDLAGQYGAQVVEASKALVQVGQVGPVVETDAGFHVLKLQGRQQALNLTAEQVKTQLQSRILFEKRNERFSKFLDELKARYAYQVNAELLAKVEVDLKAPSKESKGPQPGFIPAPTLPSTQPSPGAPVAVPPPGRPAQPLPPPYK